MKIRGINSIYTKYCSKNLYGNASDTKNERKINKADVPPAFSGQYYKINGISKEFLTYAISKIEPDKNLVISYLSSTNNEKGEFSPELAYHFLKMLEFIVQYTEAQENIKMAKRKMNKESEELNVTSSNTPLDKKEALYLTHLLFSICKCEKNGSYNFKNVAPFLDILYSIYDNPNIKTEDFAKSIKDDSGEPDLLLANSIYTILSLTNCIEPFEARNIIYQYCRDDENEINDEFVNIAIEIYNAWGGIDADAFIERAINPETKELDENYSVLVSSMLDYFSNDDCEISNIEEYKDAILNCIDKMIKISKDETTDELNIDLFEEYFEEIKEKSNNNIDEFLRIITVEY